MDILICKMQEVTNLEQYNELKKSNKLTIFDFYSTQCPPCLRIMPKFEELSEMKEYKNINFCKVNIKGEHTGPIRELEQFKFIPYFIFYKNGTKLHEYQDSSEKILAEQVEKYGQ